MGDNTLRLKPENIPHHINFMRNLTVTIPPSRSMETPKKKSKHPNANSFLLKDHAGRKPLNRWLSERKYNQIRFSEDKRGHDIIGLSWNFQRGDDPDNQSQNRGIVIIQHEDFREHALNLVKKNIEK